jgi:hypothetical protein
MCRKVSITGASSLASWPLSRVVQECFDDGCELGGVVHEIDVAAAMLV